jgi:hypothetical protein
VFRPSSISADLQHAGNFFPEAGMDHVELAAPRDGLARGCLADAIRRGGKGGTELCCLRQVQFDHDIDIGRQPWLAVHTARQRTHQQIDDALILQGIDDPAQQISLLHGSLSGRFLASRLGRPNRGAASEGDLSDFLGWLTNTHTRRWHLAHGTVGTGPLYQGRFKSFPIQEDEHFFTVCRYVERNALRANLVTSAEQWR